MRTLPRLLPAALAACVLMLATGCKASPAAPTPVLAATTLAGVTYDPKAPLETRISPLGGEGTRAFSVRYRGADGQTVPGVLTLPSAAKQRVPCVLLLHGLGGSKGDLFLASIVLARRGYASLAIDIAGHGERPRLGGKSPAALAVPEIRQAAAQTVIDLRRAVDLLLTRPEIDAGRIGFVGVSLGGILGGVFAAEEPRVRAVALWSAGGDWGKLLTQSAHAFARPLRESGATAAAVEAQMNVVDPARVAGRIAPRPLLMINGTGDTIVPRACADALYNAARQPKRLVLLPGGHIPDVITMMDRTLTWLDENLV